MKSGLAEVLTTVESGSLITDLIKRSLSKQVGARNYGTEQMAHVWNRRTY